MGIQVHRYKSLYHLRTREGDLEAYMVRADDIRFVVEFYVDYFGLPSLHIHTILISLAIHACAYTQPYAIQVFIRVTSGTQTRHKSKHEIYNTPKIICIVPSSNGCPDGQIGQQTTEFYPPGWMSSRYYFTDR